LLEGTGCPTAFLFSSGGTTAGWRPNDEKLRDNGGGNRFAWCAVGGIQVVRNILELSTPFKK
jgi:hypothetical protein